MSLIDEAGEDLEEILRRGDLAHWEYTFVRIKDAIRNNDTHTAREETVRHVRAGRKLFDVSEES